LLVVQTGRTLTRILKNNVGYRKPWAPDTARRERALSARARGALSALIDMHPELARDGLVTVQDPLLGLVGRVVSSTGNLAANPAVFFLEPN
jgi:hypothetical protein